jgi:hypothetical protein
MANAAGFEATMMGPSYVQIQQPQFPLSSIQRGAEAIVGSGTIDRAGIGSGNTTKAERRVADQSFYGEIMFASFVARKSS